MRIIEGMRESPVVRRHPVLNDRDPDYLAEKKSNKKTNQIKNTNKQVQDRNNLTKKKYKKETLLQKHQG